MKSNFMSTFYMGILWATHSIAFPESSLQRVCFLSRSTDELTAKTYSWPLFIPKTNSSLETVSLPVRQWLITVCGFLSFHVFQRFQCISFFGVFFCMSLEVEDLRGDSVQRRAKEQEMIELQSWTHLDIPNFSTIQRQWNWVYAV